ncbi:DUF21 domain-containing protein [Mycoplasma sp. SG1]|nr:DUF21 domain-containing protein [Mycoplasma sp. SG1]
MFIASFTAAAESATSTASITKIHHIFVESKHPEKTKKKLNKIIFICKNYNYVVTALISVHNIAEIVLPSIVTYCMIHWGFHGGFLAIVLIIITLLMLFLGEILPKIWGRKKPEKFSIKYSSIIYIIYLIFFPANYLVFKIFKVKRENKQQLFSEKELKTLFSLIKNEGILEEAERQMVQSAIEFDDTTIKDCYIPWDNIFSIYDDEKPSVIFEYINHLNFDYPLPILSRKTNQPVGWLNVKDFLLKYIETKDFEVDNIILDQKVIFVYDNEIKANVLAKLQTNKQWYAIVQNSVTNNVVGLITAENLFSIVVGNVQEKHVIDDFVQYLENNNWQIHPLTPLRLLVKTWKDHYDIKELAFAKEAFFYQWINDKKLILTKSVKNSKLSVTKFDGKYLQFKMKKIDNINYFFVKVLSSLDEIIQTKEVSSSTDDK